MPSLSKSSLIVSGGKKRKTLPRVPQVKVTRPRSWQALLTAPVRAAAGALVSRSSTNSIAIIAPRPRTSPTCSYFSPSSPSGAP
jgi:hypothetical protein